MSRKPHRIKQLGEFYCKLPESTSGEVVSLPTTGDCERGAPRPKFNRLYFLKILYFTAPPWVTFEGPFTSCRP